MNTESIAVATLMVMALGTVVIMKQPGDVGPYLQSEYPPSAFIEPIDCVDEGFDLPSYLASQHHAERSPVRLWWERFPVVGRAGLGHEFVSIGKEWGESCLLSPNGVGCRPFRNVIQKFKELETCLNDVQADGKWMKKKSVKMIYDRFKFSDVERIVNRLAMLANKFSLEDTEEWDRAFTSMAEDSNDQQLIKQCMNVISQDQLKCLPPLMGAPGFSGISVVEHSEHGHPDRLISHTCKIPPVCSRLAMQRLYQFQTLHFRPNYITGGADVLIQLSRRKTWVSLPDGTIRNQGCELKNPYKKEGIVCWYFPKCTQFMMEKMCQEHEQCCPSLETHQACKKDLRSPECRVCERD